ncbi:MAG TPA: TetR/AcrR family transcriptional regulator [Candidatus Xenobia bacterium]|nr:TetR/AcrR family transcriptional regulator [Candidatus Xenobia bacterium]
MEAARELFWAQGYEATSVAQILEKAEVNSGSLYHYFSSKEDLLLAVLEQYKELLLPEVIEPAFQQVTDPIERIFAILEGYRRGLLYTVFTGGCPIGNLAIEVGDHHPEARKRIAENFEGWVGWIRKCLDDAGERVPPEVDRQQLAQFVLTVMEGAVMQSRAHASIAPFDAAVATLRDYFNRLLRPPAPEIS